MNSRLCSLHNDLDVLYGELVSNSHHDITVTFNTDSTKYFTMNGSVLANLLNIDTSNKDNVIKLNGPNINTLVILMYSEKKDESTPIQSIWNWKVFFCLLEDNYYIIDFKDPTLEQSLISKQYTIDGLTSLQALHKVLYKSIDWQNFKNELVYLSSWDKKTQLDKILEQSLETALRIVFLGSNIVEKFGYNIITEIDGEKIYCHNLDTLSLETYNKMAGLSKQGIRRHSMITFNTCHQKKNKKPLVNPLCIDGISICNLVEKGLITKIEDIFKTNYSGIKVNYIRHKKKNMGEIVLEW